MMAILGNKFFWLFICIAIPLACAWFIDSS